MIGWWNDEFLGLWVEQQAVEQHAIPLQDRCWKCDIRRCHDNCAAGLCEICCRSLREGEAA